MNILFLTLVNISTFSERNIYTDLCRELMKNGHTVQLVSPIEDEATPTGYTPTENGSGILRVRTGKVQKTGLIAKGIATVLVAPRFKRAIKRHLAGQKFDLVLYSTPPITLVSVVEWVKKRDRCITYLLLKDIFPQNAVDLGMMTKTGPKSIIYRYFRNREKKLYRISDRIGCMSQANVDYVLAHNPQVNPEIVHISPNCFEPVDFQLSADRKKELLEKYDIPDGKVLFLYGGNLGKPQDVPFIVECLKAVHNDRAFFIVCGNGTDYAVFENYIKTENPAHVRLISTLPRVDYEEFVACCDVGLIFLAHRFTIPNFPSRLLSYMQKNLPVLACTDRATDIGTCLSENDCGWWCESNDPTAFAAMINEVTAADRTEKAQNSGRCLTECFSAEIGCRVILEEIKNITEKGN